MIKSKHVALVWIRSRQGLIIKKENPIKKTIAYIDGQNFMYKIAPRLIDAKIIKHKQNITSIDLPFLLQKLFPHEKIEIRYYGTAKIKRQTHYGKDIEKKSILFADNLRRLRNCFNKTGVIFRPAGSLKVRVTDVCKKCKISSYKLQEKGVDVGLAVDLVTDALTKKVQHIILVSSDTDLLPAILSAKQNKKIKIAFVGFKGEIVKAISACVDHTITLKDEDIAEAYTRANPITSRTRKTKPPRSKPRQ